MRKTHQLDSKEEVLLTAKASMYYPSLLLPQQPTPTMPQQQPTPTKPDIDMSFFTPIRSRITRAKIVAKDVTPEEVMTIINSAPETFSTMDLRILNNRYHVVDKDGKTYRFTRAGGSELTLVPASVAYRPERNSTRDLAEAIQRIETQLKELDFLSDRFREIQEEVLEIQKKLGIEHKVNIQTILHGK